MPITKFLTEAGAKKLTELIIDELKAQLEAQIVTAIDENSTDSKTPSAKAVYTFILEQIAGVAHFKFEPIEWPNPLPATGEAHIVYLKQTAEDGFWVMWYYFDGIWVELGTTAIDLVAYWKKDELVALTAEEIKAIVDEVLGITPTP